MKRVIFIAVMCAVFYAPSFAQEDTWLAKKAIYLTLDNYWHKDLAYLFYDDYISNPSADPDFYYNVGFTAGINAQNYVSFEISMSFLPSNDTIADGVVDFMVICQKAFEKGGSGFRPYFGTGLGLIWGDESAEVSNGLYEERVNMSAFGAGIVLKAGLRYYYKHFLAGAGVDYHWYPFTVMDVGLSAGGYSASASADFAYHTVKLGFHIGFIF